MANESFGKLRKLQADAQALLEGKEDSLPEERLGRSSRFVRFCVRVHRSFVQNRGPVRAAALAYTTVLALVPLLAIAVSVSAGLLKKEGEEPIQQLIDRFVAYVAPALDLKAETDPSAKATDQSNVVNKERVVTEIAGFIQKFRSGTLGASGVLALVFVAISLLGTIEAAFNDMWGVKEGRRWTTRIASYWTALTLGPLFIVAALGMTGASQVGRTKALTEPVEGIWSTFHAAQTVALMYLLPCVVLGLTLALLYLMMPNAKVDWRAALVGGFTGALLLQANSALSVMYVSRVVAYRQIYESLAVIPLFLLGLYVSWVIVLVGAQVAYVFQTRNSYPQEEQGEKMSQQLREFAALRLMTEIGQRFHEGNPPASASRLATGLAIPEQPVRQILAILAQNKLLVEASGRPIGYSPSRPLENITVKDILQALRVGIGHELTVGGDASSRRIREQLDSVQRAEEQLSGTMTLRDLVKSIRAAV